MLCAIAEASMYDYVLVWLIKPVKNISPSCMTCNNPPPTRPQVHLEATQNNIIFVEKSKSYGWRLHPKTESARQMQPMHPCPGAQAYQEPMQTTSNLWKIESLPRDTFAKKANINNARHAILQQYPPTTTASPSNPNNKKCQFVKIHKFKHTHTH